MTADLKKCVGEGGLVVSVVYLSVAVGNGLHQFKPELMNIPFIILVL